MPKLATGPQLVPLLSGASDNPSLTASQRTSFFLNTIPDRCPTAPCAYYLPFLLLTISGTLTQGGSGSIIYWDRFMGALIDSIGVNNAWHGSPVSADMVKGAHAAVWEFVANGFRYASRRRQAFPVAAAAYPFNATVAIPLSARYGNMISDTSQLAKLYQTAKLDINVPAASVLTNMSTGATLSSLTARCSAVLVPRQDLVLGTATELILHQIAAGGAKVQIKGFGTDTGLTGVENKGGVLWLGALTSALDQGGAYASANVTQVTFNWRSQQQTNHTLALALLQHAAMINDRPNIGPNTTAGTTSELDSFPYSMAQADAAVANLDQTLMLAWPLVPGGNDANLTEVQTANRDETFDMSVSGGFSGTHQIIGHYAKQWTDEKVRDWVRQVQDGGSDSLAAYVAGGVQKANGLVLARRTPRDKHVLSADQGAYLPYQLVPAESVG